MKATNGLAPTVAGVTSTVSHALTPVTDTLNGVLAPVAGQGAALSPVKGVVGQVVGTIAGGLSSPTGPAPTYSGPLVGLDAGNNVLTGPSTAQTVAGVNVLSQNPGLTSGQLVTADVLSNGKVLDVTLPTTTAGVEAGLAPVGTLVGSLVGEQATAVTSQAHQVVTPLVAPVTALVDSVASPVLDTVNGALGPVAGGVTGGNGGAGNIL
ncbi:MAG: hypothetical protein EOP02_16285, partial [Proteobacteria bacterium]